MTIRTLIMGAAGRDFHNFNVFFRDNKDYEVVAFTATQIPNIEGRRYPAELAGSLYPEGIPIYPESELQDLIRKYKVDQVVTKKNVPLEGVKILSYDYEADAYTYVYAYKSGSTWTYDKSIYTAARTDLESRYK
ncbi:MAG TPA: hypothetical protein PLV24_06585 [Anaerolineaceae bacterium]|nr:hypothetical protein [Anaerolineaceae bacterium]